MWIPALPPAQPADVLAPRALLFRPGLSALRLCLLHGTFLPTSVVLRNSTLQSSASSSAIFYLRFPRFVSFSTFAHIAFCWARHHGRILR